MKLFIKRMWTRLFWIFPIQKKKIFFTSYEGKQYSCNPKYIYERLRENMDGDYHFVWEYNAKEIPDELRLNYVITVRHNSLRYFYHVLTAGTIFTNSGITASIVLRKHQICVNTWHGGGAYKKVGAVISEEVNGTSKRELSLMARNTTYFLSSSHKFSEIMELSVLVEGDKFLEIGMPRNDIFFNDKQTAWIRERVKHRLGLKQEEKAVLYAPTYRGRSGAISKRAETFCERKILDALAGRFGGAWKFLYRGHYYEGEGKTLTDYVLDVSGYSDMQELLCMVDVLITDYSSSIWDFSLTGKPCFLFVPDLERYQEERDFYTDITSWPGELGKSEEELCQVIAAFDENEYKQKVESHHSILENCETGEAAKLLLEKLGLL